MSTFFSSYADLFSRSYDLLTSGPAVKAFHYVYIVSPIWLPVALSVGFWFIWIDYIRSKAIASDKYTLLEIKLPPEVYKSPLAMELVLAGFHQTGGEGTWYAKYVKGKTRPWFSFEIASFEGQVHFYVWTRSAFKNLIEAQFYGQYPNIEITEVPDYTDMMPRYDKDRFGLWGNRFLLTQPDPYPIKTYVDYGMDRDPKEELKIDPLTAAIEFMSLLGKGEYYWLQIVFRAHKEKPVKGSWFEKTTWQDEGKKLVASLYEEIHGKKDEDKSKPPRQPTQAEKQIIEAIERSITKYGYDVGMRGMYFAEGKAFNGTRISGFANLFKQFGSTGFGGDAKKFAFNGFRPAGTTDFDYPWQDFRKMREMEKRKKIVEDYRRRAFFHSPGKYDHFVLNSEELATIFHPLGTVLQSPTVARVQSRKAEAPSNLPS